MSSHLIKLSELMRNSSLQMECAYSVSERFRRDFSLTPYSLSVGVAVLGQCHQRLLQIKPFDSAQLPLKLTRAQQRNAMFLFLRLINQADMGYQVQYSGPVAL